MKTTAACSSRWRMTTRPNNPAHPPPTAPALPVSGPLGRFRIPAHTPPALPCPAAVLRRHPLRHPLSRLSPRLSLTRYPIRSPIRSLPTSPSTPPGPAPEPSASDGPPRPSTVAARSPPPSPTAPTPPARPSPSARASTAGTSPAPCTRRAGWPHSTSLASPCGGWRRLGTQWIKTRSRNRPRQRPRWRDSGAIDVARAGVSISSCAVLSPLRVSRQPSPRIYGAALNQSGGAHTSRPGALLLGVINRPSSLARACCGSPASA